MIDNIQDKKNKQSRSEKIEYLKQAIANGSYEIDLDKTAQKLNKILFKILYRY